MATCVDQAHSWATRCCRQMAWRCEVLRAALSCVLRCAVQRSSYRRILLESREIYSHKQVKHVGKSMCCKIAISRLSSNYYGTARSNMISLARLHLALSSRRPLHASPKAAR
jgi:hypothetical protein